MNRGGFGVGKKSRWTFCILIKAQFVSQVVLILLYLWDSCFQILKELGCSLNNIKALTHPSNYIIFNLLFYIKRVLQLRLKSRNSYILELELLVNIFLFSGYMTSFSLG